MCFAVSEVEEGVLLGVGPGHRSVARGSPAHLRCCYINKQNIWHHHISRKCTTGLRGKIWPVVDLTPRTVGNLICDL